MLFPLFLPILKAQAGPLRRTLLSSLLSITDFYDTPPSHVPSKSGPQSSLPFSWQADDTRNCGLTVPGPPKSLTSL